MCRYSRSSIVRAVLVAVISLSCLVPPRVASQDASVSQDVRSALDRISAASLKGHLSFIASDLLEGRNTPSRGLDVAAEYIAAQFRRAGLEPAGDDGYFQTANWAVAERNMENFQLAIDDGKQSLNVPKDRISLAFDAEMNLDRAQVVKVDYKDATATAALTAEQLQGKVVMTEIPDFRREDRSRRAELFRAQNDFLTRMHSSKAALVVSVDRVGTAGSGPAPGRLIDPENRITLSITTGAPLVTIHEPKAVALYDSMKPGVGAVTLSLRAPAPAEKPVKLRNVIGLLRGSDPALSDTYVLVTAHYDHIGIRGAGEGDNIFNGANDDGSGTVSVIELAAALTTLKQRPRRSILFMTFFGEERGLLGSRYYGRHPVVPIEKTVADVNLEQVGRTDSTEGPQVARATLTGFDYSDVGSFFQAAGLATGVEVYKHEQNSDSYFGRSDNQALADRGVPAHTLCVAFNYPDYHGAGDHWEKIDYANMEKVNRMIGLALVSIANSQQEPKWNETNPKAERYVKAWKATRAKN